MARYRLRVSLWPTIGALVGVMLTVALGNWQLGRGQQKAAMGERIATASHDAPIGLTGTEVNPDDVVWHRVEVRGRFEPQYTALIDNRILRGMVGYNVVTPLKIENSDRYVIVNRGWIAAAASRQTLPVVITPAETVHVTGLAVVPAHHYFELSSRTVEGNVWQNLTLDGFRARFPLKLQPVVIQQESVLDDHLAREWSPPDLGVDKHYAYAFQWFAMAVAIIVIYLLLNVRKAA
jgi:surfeit locus 1 family protein